MVHLDGPKSGPHRRQRIALSRPLELRKGLAIYKYIYIYKFNFEIDIHDNLLVKTIGFGPMVWA